MAANEADAGTTAGTGTVQGMRTVIVPVADIAAARRLYGALLGVEPVMDEPYYVGFDVDGQHLGLDPNGHGKGMSGPVGYWHVDDIGSTRDALVEAGATEDQAVTDVGGGRLVATVTDADGNVIGLLQPAAGGWS
jgi:predicted enzyme related to lactoylglutathione lyase